MGTIMRTIAASLAWIPPAMAADGSGEGSGLLIALFLGFGAMIIAFQLIPSLILFGSMLKGLFYNPAKEERKEH